MTDKPARNTYADFLSEEEMARFADAIETVIGAEHLTPELTTNLLSSETGRAKLMFLLGKHSISFDLRAAIKDAERRREAEVAAKIGPQ